MATLPAAGAALSPAWLSGVETIPAYTWVLSAALDGHRLLHPLGTRSLYLEPGFSVPLGWVAHLSTSFLPRTPSDPSRPFSILPGRVLSDHHLLKNPSLRLEQVPTSLCLIPTPFQLLLELKQRPVPDPWCSPMELLDVTPSTQTFCFSPCPRGQDLALLPRDPFSASSPCASLPGHASWAVLSLPLHSWQLVQAWNGVGTW